MGLENLRAMLLRDDLASKPQAINAKNIFDLSDIIEDIYQSGKKIVFTMGKGGVGKTTIAAAVALGLSKKGLNVHLTTTDPAAHLSNVITKETNISVSHIDEVEVLENYRQTVLGTANQSNLSDDDIAYIEEDLRSPCTQEIAVFRAFAEIVAKSVDQVVVIDTAPTGHTLLLLDSTQSYHREVERTHGETPEAVKELLPKLRNASLTDVIIVTLAETTPVYEAKRLEEDLIRAGLHCKWWVVNASLYATKTTNRLLMAKANNEVEWINRVDEHTQGNFALIRWHSEEMKDEQLLCVSQGE